MFMEPEVTGQNEILPVSSKICLKSVKTKSGIFLRTPSECTFCSKLYLLSAAAFKRKPTDHLQPKQWLQSMIKKCTWPHSNNTFV